MLTAYNASTATLSATVTDTAGDAVSGATVTVTIADRDGTALATGETMTEAGSTGVYSYTIAYNLLPTVGQRYTATITAISGSNRRTATVTIYLQKDTD